jgi:hypothetical protein
LLPLSLPQARDQQLLLDGFLQDGGCLDLF